MIYQRKSNKNYAGRLFPIEGGSRLCFLCNNLKLRNPMAPLK